MYFFLDGKGQEEAWIIGYPSMFLFSEKKPGYSSMFLLIGDGITVNKLQSLNLLFLCMFRIERKIVHVGTEKIVTLY